MGNRDGYSRVSQLRGVGRSRTCHECPPMVQNDAKTKDQSRWISWVAAFEVGRSEQASPGRHGPSFLISLTSRSRADPVNVSRLPSHRNPFDCLPAAEETGHFRGRIGEHHLPRHGSDLMNPPDRSAASGAVLLNGTSTPAIVEGKGQNGVVDAGLKSQHHCMSPCCVN